MTVQPLDLLPADWRDWSDETKRQFIDRLHAEYTRKHQPTPDPLPDSPGALAAKITGGRELQAPHLALLDTVLMRASAEGSKRIVVNIGPRYGKSRRVCRWGCAWWLQQHPDHRFVMVSYGADLVEEHSRYVRDLLERHDLGIRPRRDSRAVDEWNLEDHDGGVVAIGVSGAITGRGPHALVIDDLVKNAEEAYSKAARDKAWRAWRETLFPRLEPEASVIVVNTRWHPDDLCGRLEREEPGVWEFIRLPTLAEADDPLGRAVGEPLWPARYPLHVVLDQQRTMQRAFEAQHQQRPSIAVGGVWSEDDIRDTRISADELPPLVRKVIAVDPSASEDPTAGDEAGIVVCAVDASLRAFVLEDLSGRMDPDSWARTALLAAVEHDCDIVYESNLTPVFMRRVLKQAWAQLQRDANTLRVGGPEVLHTAVAAEGRPAYSPRDVGLLAGLPGLMPAAIPVSAKRNKLLRAEPVAQLWRQRRGHIVGRMPLLEGQMLSWRPTDSDSPDRLDAMVHGVTYLADMGTGETFATTAADVQIDIRAAIR